MSRENVEIFQRVVEAANRGDVDEVLRWVAEDVVLIPIRAATEGSFNGHPGVRAFFADNAETFDVFQLDYPDVRDLDDRVLALGSIRIRGKGSGVETDIPSGGVVWFREGKITRWEDSGDRERALQLAGLAAAETQRRER